jgi:hypothetical protein
MCEEISFDFDIEVKVSEIPIEEFEDFYHEIDLTESNHK